MSGQERDIPSPIASNLIAELRRTGMTNEQAARALGTSERQITRWRSGQQPSYRFLAQLAAMFGREIAWFYVDHDPTEAAA
jgi:transcriptional regulator with XRE-family HTH domain